MHLGTESKGLYELWRTLNSDMGGPVMKLWNSEYAYSQLG